MSKYIQNIFFLFFLVITIIGNSQKTDIFRSEHQEYLLALDLFEKQKYSAAKESFTTLIEKINNQDDEIFIHSKYYEAECALKLFNTNSVTLLNEFLIGYPEHPKSKKIPFLLNQYFYNKKDFKQVIAWAEQGNIHNLTEEEKIEHYYNLGFAHFKLENYEKAKNAFYEIKNKPSEYQTPAVYHYAYIEYKNEHLQEALTEFRKIETEDGFSKVVPYFITQILFKQKKYKEVTDYAPSKLEIVSNKKALPMKGLIGSAYYHQLQYSEAIPYLEEFVSTSKNPEENYQLAYSYYQTKEYQKAIKYFGKSSKDESLLTQISDYYLADCYIKIDQKKYAKNAFYRASELDFDKKIKEESLYQYAILTYELDNNPYDNAIKAFHQYLEEYPNSSKKEETYEYLLNVYTSTRNYKEALASLDKISDKNIGLQKAYQENSYNRGVELFQSEKYAEARKYFKNSQQYRTNNSIYAKSLYWIAQTYYKEENYAKSIEALNNFKTASGAFTSNFYEISNYDIGYAYFKSEKYPQAITSFRDFIKTNADTDLQMDAYLRIADAYFMQRQDKQAVIYYDKAITIGKSGTSYALYQKSLSSGYDGNYDAKENALEELIKKYPNSTYSINSNYELANVYRIKGKDDKALVLYQQIAKQKQETDIKRKSILNIAGIYYRQKDYQNAEKTYKEIIQKYPQSDEREIAITELEKVFSAQDKLTEYPEALASLGVNISPSKLDSVLWQPAYDAYLQADCDKTKKGMTAYLQKVENPINKNDANFFLAECFHIDNENDKALFHYEKVIENGSSKHLEDALYHAANILYENKSYDTTALYYNQLSKISTNPKRLFEASLGQMRSHSYLENYDDAIPYAKEVLAHENATSKNKMQANYILGKSYYLLNNYDDAEAHLSYVSKKSTLSIRAECDYYRATIMYQEGDYKKTEKEIFKIVNKKPKYDYWLAKTFILLADNYVKMDNKFQAKHTLQSVIDNYTVDDEIPDLAKEKLAEIIASESQNEDSEENESIEQE